MEEYGKFMDMEEQRIKDEEKAAIDFFWGNIQQEICLECYSKILLLQFSAKQLAV